MDAVKKIARYIESGVNADLNEKMVFIGGPRQVGKTTLAEQLGERFYNNSYQYLNWDSSQDRKNILSETFEAKSKYSPHWHSTNQGVRQLDPQKRLMKSSWMTP